MRQLILLILLIGTGLFAGAQDLHFSHFYHSPLYLNPAHTGNFEGNLRLGGNYRNQWQSITVPYRSFSGWGDYNFWSDGPWSAAAGLVALYDQAGDGNLTTQKLFGAASIKRVINSSLSATLGIGGGMVMKELDFSQLTFDAQWTSSGFNTNLPTNELMGEQSLDFIDLTAGLRLDYAPNSDFRWYLSFAMAHVNRPQETFYSSQNQLGMRPVVQVGGDWKLNDLWRVEPAGLFMLQKKAHEFILGANVGYTLNEMTPIVLYGGAWFRGSGDGIPSLGIQYKNVKGFVSYDINISSLQTASRSRGGMELSIVYILKWEKKPNRILVPCVRF